MSKEQDSGFFKMFAIVLGALVVFTAVIMTIANMISGPDEDAAQADPQLQRIIAQRLAPVGSVSVAASKTAGNSAPAAVAAAPKSGADIYQATCFACHGTGAAGAPKLGDKAAWEPRVAKGLDVLLQHATNGFNAMPPKGGNPALGESELKAAIEHILKKTGLSAGAATPAPAAQATAANPKPAPQAVAKATGDSVLGDPAKGESVYKSACFICHDTGAAGAPKRGDKAAWAPRIAKGDGTLLEHALKGFNAMPPKGGNPAISDESIADAIAYILEASR